MELTNIRDIRELLGRHGFSFSKGLGQNFIIDPTVCPKIAENGNAAPGWGVLEIGTGIGVLTAELAKRADRVAAVEIDTRLMPILDETLADFNNIKIYNEDVMKCDLHKLIADEFSGLHVAVCANLPYYITSPVLMLLLESGIPAESITVMVQKEAAQRLCAQVGSRDSGAITVAVNYYGSARKLFSVPRGCFMPSPNVDSAVIRIDTAASRRLPPEREKFFFHMVRGGFSQRRKTAANALSSQLGIAKDCIYASLRECGLSESARLESLTMDELISFSDTLMKNSD